MTELLDGMIFGFGVALMPENLLYCVIGVVLGTIVGVLPGIGALTAISMLLPMTFYLPPTAALVMLAGVYYGGEYGGSTASILLNLPGSPSNAVTCLDGYPMAKQGRAGVALFMTTIASFIGGTFAILVMTFMAPLVVNLAMSLGSPEYFAVMMTGLVAAGTIAQGSPVKGLAMVFLGLLLATVGTDMNSGAVRYSMGFWSLSDGIGLIPLSMGLFGVTEVISSINQKREKTQGGRITMRSMLPKMAEFKATIAPMARGCGIGSIFGALPGTGTTVAAFMTYAIEKKLSKSPERFGSGAIEGIAAPESANNAAAQTSFIPTLNLGIPGSPTMAVMMGAMMIHGIQPGPSMMSHHPDVFWGLVASFWVGNVLLLILNIPFIAVWVKILQIPYNLLYPAIIGIICIGAYSVNQSPFDVIMVFVFGIVGYGMRRLGFEPAPLVIGFVLGKLIEENFRRSMMLGNGDFLSFFQRPISGALLVITIAMIGWMFFSIWRGRARAAR